MLNCDVSAGDGWCCCVMENAKEDLQRISQPHVFVFLGLEQHTCIITCTPCGAMSHIFLVPTPNESNNG